jgi:hypothetical protein
MKCKFLGNLSWKRVQDDIPEPGRPKITLSDSKRRVLNGRLRTEPDAKAFTQLQPAKRRHFNQARLLYTPL